MRHILLSLVLGVVVGIIDIVPMFIQKLDRYAIASAFIQWVVLGFIILHLQIPGINGWFKGLLAAVLLSLPIVIIVLKTDPKAVVIILAMSAILGSLIGFVGTKI